jgi:hypothetical protein
MSKIIRKWEHSNLIYWEVDVNGMKIEVNGHKDDAAAIAHAEAIYVIPEYVEPIKVITVKEAMDVILNADLAKEDKVQLAAVSAKIAVATEVKPK